MVGSKKRRFILFGRYGCIRILPGVSCFKLFKRKQSQIALGSSKMRRPILKKTGIISMFDIDGNDTMQNQIQKFFLQARLLRMKPKLNCFEDSVAGVQAANIATTM
jgi:beta-phosphoglucomutase-like phosphatase (HAD superfamily)